MYPHAGLVNRKTAEFQCSCPFGRCAARRGPQRPGVRARAFADHYRPTVIGVHRRGGGDGGGDDVDAIDRQLIHTLRHDGRASYAELARLVGLSSSAVHERVAKLESSGVVTGFTALINPVAIGLGVTALVGIEPGEYGRDDVIAAELEAIPEVESCYGVAGDEAFVVQVRVPTVDDLHRCIGRLRGIEGVARTRTTVVLATRFEHRPTSLEGYED
jgi:Lrp/AsnC family transcriptional regulator, leucine-responsive regulatory protein